MKKIILAVLMLVCSLFCFTGCDNLGETYWKDTHMVASEIFTSQAFTKAYEISYNQNIEDIMDASYGTLYLELEEVFDPLFKSAISYSYFHYEDLQISPKNNNEDLKNAIKAVNASLESFKNTLNHFNTEKELYESWITTTNKDEVTSVSSLSHLQLFKREYIALIEKAYVLSSSIYNARRIGYYNFSDYSDEKVELLDSSADCDLAISASNLEILDVAIRIVKEYNTKESASEYEDFWKAANDYYKNIIITFKEGSRTPVEDVKVKLYNWNVIYDMFKVEKSKLFNAVSKIDLELLVECGNNLDKFEEETNKTARIYAEYYLNFYNNVDVLNSYSANLFN